MLIYSANFGDNDNSNNCNGINRNKVRNRDNKIASLATVDPNRHVIPTTAGILYDNVCRSSGCRNRYCQNSACRNRSLYPRKHDGSQLEIPDLSFSHLIQLEVSAYNRLVR